MVDWDRVDQLRKNGWEWGDIADDRRRFSGDEGGRIRATRSG